MCEVRLNGFRPKCLYLYLKLWHLLLGRAFSAGSSRRRGTGQDIGKSPFVVFALEFGQPGVHCQVQRASSGIEASVSVFESVSV